MRYKTLASSAQIAYSDLLASLYSSVIPDRGISYFTRKVKGRDYWYMQYTIGASKRSCYLGTDTEETRKLVDRVRQKQRDNKPNRIERERLVATCVATGLHSLTPAEGRVYEVLAQTGLFEVGAVIVGTHAFLHIGNMLCVQWTRSTGQTQDIDIAQDQTITVASPPVETDVAEILLEADKGVLAVPALDSRQPSTRFVLRNQNLTVSLLTPLLGKPSNKPVMIKGLNVPAEPVRYLDYLIEDHQIAAVPVGSGLLIRIPDPARFALHKLVVSQRRPVALAAKSRKDLEQSAAILEVLKALRPGDIETAASAAVQVGGKFVVQLKKAADLLDGELRTLVHDYSD